MYADDPSASAATYATGLLLNKPWFTGEAGCGVGDTACTYDGANAAAVDQWWLTNLPKDGARSVLIESRVTAWQYPMGARSQTLTATGQEIRAANS